MNDEDVPSEAALRQEFAELKQMNADLRDKNAAITKRSDKRFYIASIFLALCMAGTAFAAVRSALNATAINDLQDGDSCGMTAINIDPDIRQQIPENIWSIECPGIKNSLDRRDRILQMAEERGIDITP